MSAVTTTTYLGFTIIVCSHDFVILDRDRHPVAKTSTMQAARRIISQLRRAERDA